MAQELHQTLQDRSDTISKEIKLQNEALNRRADASNTSVMQTLDKLSNTIQKAVERYEFPGQTRASAEEVQAAILRTLLYPTMEARYGSIAEAHARTFSWILDPPPSDCPWDDFMEWLRGENAIYWVTGKAASGKSTLVKFLLQQPKVEDQLRQWAGGKPLVRANFFFWALGSPVQKSQSGLLRSLLYDALRQQRSLIPRMFPDMWKQLEPRSSYLVSSLQTSWHSWSHRDLRILFDSMIREGSSTTKFCFFIDGLDEFDGDHLDIAYFIREIAANANVKVCVSSRPLMAFEHEFQLCKHLRLQDLTANDIRIYVHDQLNSHRHFAELTVEDPEGAPRLVGEVVKISSGVFLWVRLAVKSLLKGLSNHDTIRDLQRRLRELPPELEALYGLMLSSIDPPFYVEQAARLFQIVYQAGSPISVLRLSFADQNDHALALSAAIGQLPKREIERRIRDMTNRLKSRCGGLLEVAVEKSSDQIDGVKNRQQVQYLHLTVREFLEKPDVWSDLLGRTAGTGFDASVALLRSCILVLKCTRLAWNDHLSSQIEPALTYGLLAENSTGQPQVDLIDELDRVAQLLYPAGHKYREFDEGARRYAADHKRHWSTDRHRGGDFEDRPTPFQTYAVAKGLTLYVQAKAGRSLLSLNVSATRPLLLYAKDWANKIHNRSEGDALGQENSAEVQPSMVAMLLQGNLNPNQAFNGSTPWIDLLTTLLSQTRTSISVPAVWIDVCRLFLLYGADPKGDSWKFEIPGFDSGLHNNVYRVLNAVFSHLADTNAFRQLLELQAERCRAPVLLETKEAESFKTDAYTSSTSARVITPKVKGSDYHQNKHWKNRGQKKSGYSKRPPKFFHQPARPAPGYQFREICGQVVRASRNFVVQGHSGVQEQRMGPSMVRQGPKVRRDLPRRLDSWVARPFDAPSSSHAHRHYRVTKSFASRYTP
jgi:hypothetical protein